MIYLDSVVCNGSERTLQQCTANPVGVHDCDHSEDAGVRCGGIIFLLHPYLVRRKRDTYMYILILIRRKRGNYIRLLCTMLFFSTKHFPNVQRIENTEILAFFMQLY